MKTAYVQISKDCLGTRERKRKKWITPGTWQAIITRRNLRKSLLGLSLRNRKKSRNSSIRRQTGELRGWKGKRNERSWTTLQARQKTQLTKGSKEVYKISKIVCGKYRGTTDEPVKDKQGQLLTSEAKIDA